MNANKYTDRMMTTVQQMAAIKTDVEAVIGNYVKDWLSDQDVVLTGLDVQAKSTPAMAVLVKAGTAVQADTAGGHARIYLASDVEKAIGASDPSQARTDIIVIKYATQDTTSLSQWFIDQSGQPYQQSVDTRVEDYYDIQVVAGVTGSGSPPATPSGYFKLAEVLVSAGVSTITSDKITDRRPMLGSLTADSSVVGAMNFRKMLGHYSNLQVKTDATHPDHKLDITFDSLCVADASNPLNVVELQSQSLTVDVETSGVGGLDTGSEAASTWYYAWVIYNLTTNTAAAILSTSNSAPSPMPSGYTFKRLVGAVRNDSGSDFFPFRQFGDHVRYIDEYTVLNNVSVSTSWSAITCDTLIPGNAPFGEFTAYLADDTSAGVNRLALNTSGTGTGIIVVSVGVGGWAGGCCLFSLDLTDQNKIWWEDLEATACKNTINIIGFKFNL